MMFNFLKTKKSESDDKIQQDIMKATRMAGKDYGEALKKLKNMEKDERV